MSVTSAKAIFADSEAYKADTNDDGISPYLLERRKFYTDDNWNALLLQLSRSCTLYVGNLGFYTTEEQLLELFSRVGEVKKLIMGLNKEDKTPCGFCFVEYHNHSDAQSCQRFLSGTSLDDRVIRADLDPGFEEGRQFGRSKKSGGQRRDDFRDDFDAGRGGWSAARAAQQAAQQQRDVYQPMGGGDRGNTGGRSRSRSRERQREAKGRSRSRSKTRRDRSDSRSPRRRKRSPSPDAEGAAAAPASAAMTDA